MSKTIFCLFTVTISYLIACSSGAPRIKGNLCKPDHNPLKLLDEENEGVRKVVKFLSMEKDGVDPDVEGLPEGVLVFNGAEYLYLNDIENDDQTGGKKALRNNVIVHYFTALNREQEWSIRRNCNRGLKPNQSVQFPIRGTITRMQPQKDDDNYMVESRLFDTSYENNRLQEAFVEDQDVSGKPVKAPKDIYSGNDTYKSDYQFYQRTTAGLGEGQSRYELRSVYELSKTEKVYVFTQYKLCTPPDQNLDEEIRKTKEEEYNECVKGHPFADDEKDEA